jgi:hypothetical protein
MSWEFYASIGGLFITVITSAVILSYRFGCNSERVQASLRALRDQLDGQLTLLGVLISILHKRKALDDTELQEVLQRYGSIATAKAPRFVPTGNPLSNDEAWRLNNYIDKARRGEFFTTGEVEDYNVLIGQAQQDRPNDPGLWPLAALGAFLLGIFLASRKQ